jgi:1,2-diacylglycerol 3-alpha-glucosyltransferase
MNASGSPHLKLALLSSGLGYTARGIEIWMAELAAHLPDDIALELWSGGPTPSSLACPAVSLHGLSRDASVLGGISWHRRYQIEQLSVLAQALLRLRRHKLDAVYCGDPVLSWHLKRFRSVHGAKVVFMNGMRLSAQWAKDFAGVHLLAPPYLEAARRELPGQKLDQFFVVPHFADLTRFIPATTEQRVAARQRLGLKADAFVILNVGPIGQVSGKRLEWLAEEVASASRDTLLLSAGLAEDGAENVRQQVVQALGSRARFLGAVARANMPELFHAADAYALASLAEPFSIAILEALASGLPVVHHADEVMQWQTGAGGVAVSMTAKGEAASVLRGLEHDPLQRRELGSAARRLAETRYAPARISRQIADALLKICGRKPVLA